MAYNDERSLSSPSDEQSDEDEMLFDDAEGQWNSYVHESDGGMKIRVKSGSGLKGC